MITIYLNTFRIWRQKLAKCIQILWKVFVAYSGTIVLLYNIQVNKIEYELRKILFQQ